MRDIECKKSEKKLFYKYSRICLIRHRLIRLIRHFFVGPGRIPIFYVHFCSSNSPSSNSVVPNRGFPDPWGSETTFSWVRNAIFDGESLYVTVGYTFCQNNQDL